MRVARALPAGVAVVTTSGISGKRSRSARSQRRRRRHFAERHRMQPNARSGKRSRQIPSAPPVPADTGDRSKRATESPRKRRAPRIGSAKSRGSASSSRPISGQQFCPGFRRESIRRHGGGDLLQRALEPCQIPQGPCARCPQLPAVEIDHADGPVGIEQNVMSVQIRVIDALRVQSRDRRADGTPPKLPRARRASVPRSKAALARCAA